MPEQQNTSLGSSPAHNLFIFRVLGAEGASRKAQEANFFSELSRLHVKTNRRAVWLCVLHPQRGAGALERFCVDVVSEPAVRAVNPLGKGCVGAVFIHNPVRRPAIKGRVPAALSPIPATAKAQWVRFCC